jgi:hypothetical protein
MFFPHWNLFCLFTGIKETLCSVFSYDNEIVKEQQHVIEKKKDSQGHRLKVEEIA